MIRFRRAWLSGGIVLGAASLVVPLVVLSGSANAAPARAADPTSYQGTFGSGHRLTQAASISSLPKVASSFRNEGPRALTPVRVRPTHTSTVGASDAAPADATPLGSFNGVLTAFNGLSDVNSDELNGGEDTPPDQGLCIGRDTTLPGSPEAVIEPINSASRETDTHGNLLRPDVSLATLFADPYASGDVRCLYDARDQTFFFTEIGFPVATGPSPSEENTVDDVVVMNRSGVAAYQFDSSLGGTCLGDQPKTGFDNNALVISTDEYCGPQTANEIGAIATVISLPQLVAEDATVNDATVGPVSLAGDPVVGLDPAINTGSGTAYFLNTDPFLANGNNNPVGDVVGVWTLSNSAAVTNGSGTITLTSVALPSEPYAFPVPAASTGTGTVTTVDGFPITSENFLNPDDSRLSEPVWVTRDILGGIDLWTATDAAVTPRGDSAVRDGAAWFRIRIGGFFGGGPTIVRQGYVTAVGAYLLYPALAVPQLGDPDMVFTITSSTINPSAAYTVLGSGKIVNEAAGADPHVSFSDVLFDEPRWGDYSWAQVDPDGTGVWLATEYIPPTADQDPIDNWGTYMFKVNNFSFSF